MALLGKEKRDVRGRGIIGEGCSKTKDIQCSRFDGSARVARREEGLFGFVSKDGVASGWTF